MAESGSKNSKDGKQQFQAPGRPRELDEEEERTLTLIKANEDPVDDLFDALQTARKKDRSVSKSQGPIEKFETSIYSASTSFFNNRLATKAALVLVILGALGGTYRLVTYLKGKAEVKTAAVESTPSPQREPSTQAPNTDVPKARPPRPLPRVRPQRQRPIPRPARREPTAQAKEDPPPRDEQSRDESPPREEPQRDDPPPEDPPPPPEPEYNEPAEEPPPQEEPRDTYEEEAPIDEPPPQD